MAGTNCEDWVQYADIDTPSGLDDVIESTRLNASQGSMIRPNVTSNISNIPRSSHLEQRSSDVTDASDYDPSDTRSTEEAQTPEEINAALSMAVEDLDITKDETDAGKQLGQPLEEADVEMPPKEQPQQTTEEIHDALAAAVDSQNEEDQHRSDSRWTPCREGEKGKVE